LFFCSKALGVVGRGNTLIQAGIWEGHDVQRSPKNSIYGRFGKDMTSVVPLSPLKRNPRFSA